MTIPLVFSVVDAERICSSLINLCSFDCILLVTGTWVPSSMTHPDYGSWSACPTTARQCCMQASLGSLAPHSLVPHSHPSHSSGMVMERRGGGILNMCWVQQKWTKVEADCPECHFCLKRPWVLNSAHVRDFSEFMISKHSNSEAKEVSDIWNIWDNAWFSESWQIACLFHPRLNTASPRQRQSRSPPSAPAGFPQGLGFRYKVQEALQTICLLWSPSVPCSEPFHVDPFLSILLYNPEFDTYPQTLREVELVCFCPTIDNNRLCPGKGLR